MHAGDASTAFADLLRLETPVVQAGMGGGLATAPLAAAVSRAGGLGTVGILPDPRAFAAELRRARALAPGRPMAANLLVPFTRRGHVDACIAAGTEVVVTFCGSAPWAVSRLRRAGVVVLAQVGTEAQARQALADGAHGLIAQGLQAGGHVLGVEPTGAVLRRLVELAGERPVLAAGGLASRQAVREILEAGAAGAVAGTRFLLTEECMAHPAYKRRALGARRTLLTELFSVGWADAHRVVPNAATARWCDGRGNAPRAVVTANRLLAPAVRRLPPAVASATLRRQSLGVPLYTPAAVLEGMDEGLVERTPLYAGECAARITSVVAAADAVRDLAP